MILPVSIKAVVMRRQSDTLRVLLLRNGRDEWELPGGRLDEGEQPEATLRRELREELAVDARIGPLLDSHVFEVLPGRPVFIVTYACVLPLGASPQLSSEHRQWDWFLPASLPDPLPAGYRASILRAVGLAAGVASPDPWSPFPIA